MLNIITPQKQVSFTGKTFSRKAMRECEEFCSDIYREIKTPKSSAYRAYARITTTPQNLERGAFSYKTKYSKELKPYTGTLKHSAGFSTEAGGYGGGWIKSTTSTPLSTKDVHTCALLNLIDETTNEQMLYHVYSETSFCNIKKLILQEFPNFTKVNIMPGDQFKTNTTVNNINKALDEINPKITKQYYHMPVENPEVIAIDGELQFLKNKKPDEMTFVQVTDQYNY